MSYRVKAAYPAGSSHGTDCCGAEERDRRVAAVPLGPSRARIHSTAVCAEFQMYRAPAAPAQRGVAAGLAGWKIGSTLARVPAGESAGCKLPKGQTEVLPPSFPPISDPWTAAGAGLSVGRFAPSDGESWRPADSPCATGAPAGARCFAADDRQTEAKSGTPWIQLGKASNFATLSGNVDRSPGFCIRKRCSSGMRTSALSSVGSVPFW